VSGKGWSEIKIKARWREWVEEADDNGARKTRPNIHYLI
jgi:hypothetical protein